MAPAISQSFVFKVEILLFFLAFTTSASPVSTSHWEEFAKIILPRTNIIDYGNTTDPVLHLDPKASKLIAPWWTGIVTTVGDFIIALWTVTFAWEKRGSGAKPAGWKSVTHKLFDSSWIFVQGISGLIHLAMNSHRGDGLTVVQRPSGNNYVALFAAAAQLWHKTNLENPKTLLVIAYGNCVLQLLLLVLLSLPVVGSAPLFQAWAPGCSFIVNSGNDSFGTYGANFNPDCSNFGWINGSTAFNPSAGPEFTCATMYELGLGRDGLESRKIQSYFSWFYVGFLAILIIGTVLHQVRNPIKQDEYRSVGFVGYVMFFSIFIAMIYGGVWIGIDKLEYSEGLTASVVTCPSITNSTLGVQKLNNATCTCVDISRSLGMSLKQYLDGDATALSRLVSNF